MSLLSDAELAGILAPYAETTASLRAQLGTYLELLLKWNARVNLTAIRDPKAIVARHFGESLFVARHLPPCGTLLDFGSGAGFPGLPIQLALPELRVTLAESQGKKAAFLSEVVRVLGLQTEVWAGRVESMPRGRLFDIVALRAVDDPARAVAEARIRVRTGGALVELTTGGGNGVQVPNSGHGVVAVSVL
jgi:16S rRNA (guanine527-N7)-methyltransferase